MKNYKSNLLINKYIDNSIITFYYMLNHKNISENIIQIILNFILSEQNIINRLKDNNEFYDLKYILNCFSNDNKNNIEIY